MKKLKKLDQTTSWIGSAVLSIALASIVYYITLGVSRSREEMADALDTSVAEKTHFEHHEDFLSHDKEPAKLSHHESSRNNHENIEDEVQSITFSAKRFLNGLNWGYAGAKGASFWKDLHPDFLVCGVGKMQSPVDIIKAERTKDIPSLKISYGEAKGDLRHENSIASFHVDNKPYVRIDDDRFQLIEVVFHGPSEHKFEGLPYDMEIQFLHKNDLGKYAVLSVLVEESRLQNSAIAQMVKKLPAKNDFPVKDVQLNLLNFLPNGETFYYYEGSLTVPPCTENVQWFVFKNILKASGTDIDRFNNLVKFNARPVQELYSRLIKLSWR